MIQQSRVRILAPVVRRLDNAIHVINLYPVENKPRYSLNSIWWIALSTLRTNPKAPETFRARIASFSLSVSKNGEAYTPETSCMKRTSILFKNMCVLQFCNNKV